MISSLLVYGSCGWIGHWSASWALIIYWWSLAATFMVLGIFSLVYVVYKASNYRYGKTNDKVGSLGDLEPDHELALPPALLEHFWLCSSKRTCHTIWPFVTILFLPDMIVLLNHSLSGLGCASPVIGVRPATSHGVWPRLFPRKLPPAENRMSPTFGLGNTKAGCEGEGIEHPYHHPSWTTIITNEPFIIINEPNVVG